MPTDLLITRFSDADAIVIHCDDCAWQWTNPCLLTWAEFRATALAAEALLVADPNSTYWHADVLELPTPEAQDWMDSVARKAVLAVGAAHAGQGASAEIWPLAPSESA